MRQLERAVVVARARSHGRPIRVHPRCRGRRRDGPDLTHRHAEPVDKSGIGFYSLALTGTAVVLIALLVFRHVRTLLLQRVQSDRFLVEVEVAPDRLRDMLDLVAEHDAVLDSLDCEQEGGLTAVRMHLRVPPGTDRAALVEAIEAHTSVASAHAKRGLDLVA